jgi:hypothetical protein
MEGFKMLSRAAILLFEAGLIKVSLKNVLVGLPKKALFIL